MAAFDKSDLMLFGILMLILFVIAVLTVMTYIGLDEMRSVSCTQSNSAFEYADGVCYNCTDSGGSVYGNGAKCANNDTRAAATVATITKINIVEAAVDIALSLLGLVVLIAVFAVVIKIAVQFKDVF